MLEKRLTLGGLQVGGPRTLQNTARFRVANNVYQTADGQMIPRFDNKAFVTGLPSGVYPINVYIFKKEPFVVCTDQSTGLWRFFYGETPEEIHHTITFLTGNGAAPGDAPPFGIQFIEKNDTLYFNIPAAGLYKFDGTVVRRAGVPTSYGAFFTLGGSEWVRIVQSHLDFAGNVTHSGYVQMPFTAGAGTTLATKADVVGSLSGATPTRRQVWDSMGMAPGEEMGFDLFYYNSSDNPTVVDDTVEMFLSPGEFKLEPDCWVKAFASPFLMGPILVALKVKSLDDNAVVFDKVKFFNGDTWGPEMPAAALGSDTPTMGGTQWLSVWTSDIETGNYVFKGGAWVGQAYAPIDTSNPTTPAALGIYADTFNISGNLGDWYDVTSAKTPFPCLTEELPTSAITVYGDMLCAAQRNEVYFSDTTLGGTFEMTNALAFITVGDAGEGPIQSVCGNNRFLLLSRQYKNYYITGNLPTANYAAAPISATSLGAYSNESTISVAETIFFLNKSGFWAVYQGGKCEKVSQNIEGLFDTFSKTTTYAEELKWDINNYPAHIDVFMAGVGDEVNKWVRLRFDNCRNLLLVLIRGADGKGNALVLNLNNGEWTTWDKISETLCLDMTFYRGVYFATDGYAITKEEKSDPDYKYNYFEQSPPELITTWLTAGEPSLEKKVKQVKLFGQIKGELEIAHYADWKDAPEGIANYLNDEAGLFSHKKRITPYNALAASVGVKVRGELFEIEGLEVEFDLFQQGMKR